MNFNFITKPTYKAKEVTESANTLRRWIIYHKLSGHKIRVRGRLTPSQRETIRRNDRKHIKVHRQGCCGTYGLLGIRHYCYNDFKPSDLPLLRKLGIRQVRWEIYIY